MAKIAFLATDQEMFKQAQKIAKKIEAEVELKLTSSGTAVADAKLSFENGASVVITRGNQASLISRYTNIPIVEIVLTGQEIAKLIWEAKEILKKPCPLIGIIGFVNMFSTTKLFDEILDVTIKEYFVKYSEELEGAVKQAIEDGVDFIIGGQIVNKCAQELGIPTLFLKSREDSIKEAFRVAEKVAYVSDLEKKNTAEFKTILDYSFDAIIKLDYNGVVVVLNYLAEKILKKSSEEIIGKHITKVISILDEDVINNVLTEGKSLYSILLQQENLALVANIAPIEVDDKIEGAILSFQEFKKIEELEEEIRKEIYSKGYIAKYTFNNIIGESSEINELKSLAKLYAKHDAPILITGESGTGKKLFAQSIHNESLRKDNPFVYVNCASMQPEQLIKTLSGYVESNYYNLSTTMKKGLFEIAHTGTLYLDRISEMGMYGQLSLLRVLNEKSIIRIGESRALPVNIRIICSTNKNILPLIKEGRFSEELYYMLNVLSLDIKPLRERKKDISILLESFIEEYSNTYKKYVILTDGAKELIASHPWYGNVLQLKKFCEKIVIVATKKVLNEEFINKHLEYHSIIFDENKYDVVNIEPQTIIYKNPETAKILELFEKYNGNREKVAEELNISKTTLWRKIKKYNIKFKLSK